MKQNKFDLVMDYIDENIQEDNLFFLHHCISHSGQAAELGRKLRKYITNGPYQAIRSVLIPETIIS